MHTYAINKIIALSTIISLMLVHNLAAQNTSPLFPIEQKGKWGFINQEGKVIIKPIFENVGEFSYGLAPARSKGRYGYINRKGLYQIKPVFDHGSSFVEGIAFVNIDGKKFLIDTMGTLLFQHNYKNMICADEPCTMKRFIVTTQHSDQGVIDVNGKIILDTIYRTVYQYTNGVAVINGYRYYEYLDSKTSYVHEKWGVIDEYGKFIVPFGKYQEIQPFSSGVANTLISKTFAYYHFGLIDINGNIIDTYTGLKYEIDYYKSKFQDHVLPVHVYLEDSIGFKLDYKEGTFRKGFINQEGRIVSADTIVNQRIYINPEWKYKAKNKWAILNNDGKLNLLDSVLELKPFFCDRSFALKNNDIYRSWYLINKNGRILNQTPYYRILGDGFNKEVAFVEVMDGYVPIDTFGNFIYNPRKIDFDRDDYYFADSCLFFKTYLYLEEKDEEKELWGYWDLKTNTFIKAKFDKILSPKGFQNGLLYVLQDDIKGYINRAGNYVWRENERKKDQILKLNIEYMLTGGFSAASPYKAELAGFGGWATSDNTSQKVKKDKKIKPNQFYMEVRENEKETYADQYKGFAFYVINTTPDTIVFEAQDSWLYLKIETQDDKGNWHPIQYIPSSWCGNSYHQVFLAKNEYWKFTMPKFSGAQKTKLRLALQYKDQQTSQIRYIYSNTIKGKINPAQFWQKQEYAPSNLMDPYGN